MTLEKIEQISILIVIEFLMDLFSKHVEESYAVEDLTLYFLYRYQVLYFIMLFIT